MSAKRQKLTSSTEATTTTTSSTSSDIGVALADYKHAEQAASVSADLTSADRAVTRYLQSIVNVSPEVLAVEFEQKLRSRQLTLDMTRADSLATALSSQQQQQQQQQQREPRPPRSYNKRTIGCKEARKLKLFDISSGSHKYTDFYPIHMLWSEYIISQLAGVSYVLTTQSNNTILVQ
jgi:hypothetical protein